MESCNCFRSTSSRSIRRTTFGDVDFFSRTWWNSRRCTTIHMIVASWFHVTTLQIGHIWSRRIYFTFVHVPLLLQHNHGYSNIQSRVMQNYSLMNSSTNISTTSLVIIISSLLLTSVKMKILTYPLVGKSSPQVNDIIMNVRSCCRAIGRRYMVGWQQS